MPSCTLSIVPRVPRSTAVHVSASPPLIPDSRLSRVRLAAIACSQRTVPHLPRLQRSFVYPPCGCGSTCDSAPSVVSEWPLTLAAPQYATIGGEEYTPVKRSCLRGRSMSHPLREHKPIKTLSMPRVAFSGMIPCPYPEPASFINQAPAGSGVMRVLGQASWQRYASVRRGIRRCQVRNSLTSLTFPVRPRRSASSPTAATASC